MREFNLKVGDPISLTIAADARITKTNYLNDQIWELNLAGGEPIAVGLETTYGLRVRSMRLFPRFVEGHTTLTDPNQFASPPVVRRFLPNFLEIVFFPFSDLEVKIEYWAVSSEAITGRIRTTNTGTKPRQVRLEWAGLLTPAEGNQLMRAVEIGSIPILAGDLVELAPVVFITGGAFGVTSPFPALVIGLDLAPGKSRQLTWCHAARVTQEASFEAVQQIISRNWEAELARLELMNGSLVELFTGNPDWDAAFAFSQKNALSLFHSPDDSLPYPSFVTTRNPDQGFSLRGDGSDYGLLWNGQSPLDTYYLANILLPVAPDLIKGVVYNFLSTQKENGEIDWKPGLAGHRSNRLATPLIACISWEIFQLTEDEDFLHRVFDPLTEFFLSWFAPEHDRDEDGIPEWDHPTQIGLDDHPIFSRWHTWAQGVDISTAESPSLCAFLYKECQSLIEMSFVLGRNEMRTILTRHGDHLREAVESLWMNRTSSYLYRDRDTHDSPKRQKLGERQGEGVIDVQQSFDQPIRPVLSVVAGEETSRRPQVFIHGTSAAGDHRIESIPPERFLWFPGWGTSTSEKAFASIEYVDIRGLGVNDRAQIHSAGFAEQDLTNLLPLWAEMPSQNCARKLIRSTLTKPDKYWQKFGLPVVKLNRRRPETRNYQHTNLPWSALIGEGLSAYGYQQEAAELVTHLMDAIVQTMKRDACFRQQYHSSTGQGIGERNALSGLAPLGLFLSSLGVHLISSHRVILDGSNPYPWPITIKYRGLTILRGKDKTQVIFSDGQTVSVPHGAKQVIALE